MENETESADVATATETDATETNATTADVTGEDQQPSSDQVTDGTGADAAPVPEFAEAQERNVTLMEANTDRLHAVKVPVWVELGRIEMLIGELLRLGEGSVLQLDRSIGDPVDLVSQGVKLARGEVIVVEDRFAIRIREVFSGK